MAVLATVVAAALASGAGIALVVENRETDGVPSETRESDAPVAVPIEGSGRTVTDAPSPTPILSTISPIPESPKPFDARPDPPDWVGGRYRVRFEMKADSCGEYVPSQEHDLVVSRDGENLRVEDTYTGYVMVGPAAEDGTFRVEFSHALVSGSSLEARQVMTGKFTREGLAGDFFAYPPGRGCAVQLVFSGPKVS